MRGNKAWLLLVLMLLTGLYGWIRPQIKDQACAVTARAIARAIPGEQGPDAAQVQGAEVLLFNGEIRLLVHPPPQQEDVVEGVHHLHVLTTSPLSPGAEMDACLFAVADEGTKSADLIAEKYIQFVWPSILSVLRGEPLLDATPFHGTEAFGVPGRYGFVGVGQVHGLSDVDLARTPVFSDLPPFPPDGRAHLIKVSLLGAKGAWTRSVEVDGTMSLVTNQPWTGAPPPPDVAVLILFATVGEADKMNERAVRAEDLRRLARRPAWLPAPDECPFALMPPSLAKQVAREPDACLYGRLDGCLLKCERGHASSCYEAALAVQDSTDEQEGVPPEQNDAARDLSEALFRRACSLGHASGCTNAAAGWVLRAGRNECSTRTFERVCDGDGDPWACTMLGGELLSAPGVRRDAPRIKAVLKKGCRHSSDDPACQRAMEHLGDLEQDLRKAKKRRRPWGERYRDIQ